MAHYHWCLWEGHIPEGRDYNPSRLRRFFVHRYRMVLVFNAELLFVIITSVLLVEFSPSNAPFTGYVSLMAGLFPVSFAIIPLSYVYVMLVKRDRRKADLSWEIENLRWYQDNLREAIQLKDHKMVTWWRDHFIEQLEKVKKFGISA